MTDLANPKFYEDIKRVLTSAGNTWLSFQDYEQNQHPKYNSYESIDIIHQAKVF